MGLRVMCVSTNEIFVKLPSGRVKAGQVQRALISDRGWFTVPDYT